MNEMILSTDIQRLVDVRNAVVKKISDAMNLVREAEDMGRKVGLGCMRDWMNDSVKDALRFGEDACSILCGEIDRAGWACLMNQSGMIDLMDAKARTEWCNQIHDGKVPELNLENILSTFQMLHDQKDAMFERGVIEVFKHLSWDYRTNSPAAFGKKIIMDGAFEYWSNGFWPNYPVLNRLNDLERIMTILDGKPVPESRNKVSAKLSGLIAEKRSCNVYSDHPYFDLSWFKKGTLHIVFKRQDLVTKMNRILAKHYPGSLPPAARQ
ncbi:MAG TPA: DUF4942 domain-containing protein [Rhodobacteraceae bacterium]|nr:DUF4942 domain-containing protein [Paracoccaceae bacterium]